MIVVAIGAAWFGAAALLALLIGRAIKRADDREAPAVKPLTDAEAAAWREPWDVWA